MLCLIEICSMFDIEIYMHFSINKPSLSTTIKCNLPCYY